MTLRPTAGEIILAVSVLMLCVQPGSAQFRNNPLPKVDLQYGQAMELCRLRDDRIGESSGIAASNCTADAFWTHNDSGDSARIFLFNKKGETLSAVNITGASAVDWEDIASFKAGDECRVLIADTGDNARKRKSYMLYLIREPSLRARPEDGEPMNMAADLVSTIEFTYEDGSHDCEAVAVDPTTFTVYLVGKEREGGKIYSLPIPQEGSKQQNVAKAIASVTLPYATAMDIAPDGKRAVILTYGDAFEFTRSDSETWDQAFAREPRTIKAPARKQGEAVCYGIDGRTLYFTSEGKSQPVWELPVVQPTGIAGDR